MLPSLKSLEVINFGDCLVKTEGAKELAKSLRSGVNNLQELNLSYDEINKEGALAIVEALESKDCLKKLELNGEHIKENFSKLVLAIVKNSSREVATSCWVHAFCCQPLNLYDSLLFIAAFC